MGHVNNVKSQHRIKLSWILSKLDFVQNCCFSQHSCISRRQFTALSRLSKPTSLGCYAFSFYCTSSSSMHMCISLELFMPCFVFNTPSCKSKAARHKAVKTPLPSNPPHLGWRIYGQVIAPETEAERSLPGPLLKLGTLLLDAPPHFVSFWTCSTPRGWCHWQHCLTPIPQHLPGHLELRLGFSSFHLPSKPYPSMHFKNLLPKSKVVCIVTVWTLHQCHVSSLNWTAADNSQREHPRLFVTVVWWFWLKPGVSVKSSLPLTLQPCGLCAWQLSAL